MLSGEHLHESEGGAEHVDQATQKPRHVLSAAEERLLTHHAGLPEDHKHNFNAPIDRKSDQLLREGALDDVIALAELAPTRVAEAISRNRLILDHFHDHDHEARDRLLALTWDALDPEVRRMFEARMLRMVVNMARRVQVRQRRRDGRAEVRPFRFDSDELDLDRTLDAVLAAPLRVAGGLGAASYAQFMVGERRRKPCAYAVVIDESRSMRGSKALVAALAAAVLLLNLHAEDSYTLIGFAEHARTIRALARRTIREDVIRELLHVQPDGCTDLAAGLGAARVALAQDGNARRVAILITDGWLNTGHDPLALASGFDQLNVIELPGGDPGLCRQLATLGGGRRVAVGELAEVPAAVRDCLSR